MLHVPETSSWSNVAVRARALCPEAFQGERLLNLIDGAWGHPGSPSRFFSPNDGTELYALPMIDLATASAAVKSAHKEQSAWGELP